MDASLIALGFAAAAGAAWTLILATLLGLVGRLGSAGDRFAQWAVRAPGLDGVVAALTWAPWVLAGVIWGWRGLVGVLAGQMVGLGIWIVGHELKHRKAVKGPRIVKFLNRLVGRWRNHAALWVTVITFPVFWVIRLAEVAMYPLLTWLVGFPRYKQGDWVNVSRQKFSGLVGHDLVWCLYCDWMTGVYSLGGEMLRNVESFWCPIRFYDGKKCANCKVDFPDIDGAIVVEGKRGEAVVRAPAWTPADGSMGDVVDLMERMYGPTGPDGDGSTSAGGRRGWFGHPARLTINGQSPKVDR
ncbi:MAG: hypothetical protein H7Y88_05665 [Phycisphaerales bacterium]|nr:hypothetical protein [Phycisphaerales bacterium]